MTRRNRPPRFLNLIVRIENIPVRPYTLFSCEYSIMSTAVSHRPSPKASPSLRAIPFSAPSPSSSPMPIFASTPNPLPSSAPRSYARAPPQRPYALQTRFQQKREPIDGDTRAFADKVVAIIETRARKARAGGLFNLGEAVEDRKGGSLEGNLSGSWEIERAEFIVDIPVWSPGCFQGESMTVW